LYADKDASLVLGFNHEIDKATYLQALHQNKLMDLLNVQKVEKRRKLSLFPPDWYTLSGKDA